MIRAGTTRSDDDGHRYRLWARWDENVMPVLFMGMRPSWMGEASEQFAAESWALKTGHGGFELCNFYGIDSSEKEFDINSVPDPIGPDNTTEVLAAISSCSTVVFDINPWPISGPYENGLLLAMRQAAHDATNFVVANETGGDFIVSTRPAWPLDREDAPEPAESTPE